MNPQTIRECVAQSLKQVPVTVFLTNGVKLSGCIAEVLSDGFILVRDGNSQLVYQHATATIMPNDGNTSLAK